MSRCFPFPPPNYREEKSLAESIKLLKDQEASKEKKKEKKRERKERKEKRDKPQDDNYSLKHREHGHKKRKNEERNELQRKDGLLKEAEPKEVFEQLEKSDLTEDHGLPRAIQEPCKSSESTQNSSKSLKLQVPNSSSGSQGSTILRLRLLKHKDPKPTPTSANGEPLFSGRVIPKDLKATPASEGACFSCRTTSKALRVAPESEGPCFSGRTTTSEVLSASPSSEGSCFFARAPSKGLEVTASSQGPSFSGRATPQDLRATLVSEVPCFSGRCIPNDLGAVPANEDASWFSGRATKVPLLHKLSDDAHSQPIVRSKQQSSNLHILSVEDIKASEVPQEQKCDENVHTPPSSISKGSKRARKLEKRFGDLIASWKPATLFLDAEHGTDDISWLFRKPGQHCVKSDVVSCGVSSTVVDLGRGSRAFPFETKALYLPDLEMHQLPYVVPF